MAGMAGFEPANDGVKVRYLTAWLHPYMKGKWAAEPTTACSLKLRGKLNLTPESLALPIRNFFMVSVMGVEPTR